MVNFETVKSAIAQFNIKSLLKESHRLSVLLFNSKDKSYPFWQILVLMKWAFIYGNNTSEANATLDDIQRLIILINKFHDNKNPIDFKQGIKRSFKIMAFQQFWFQNAANVYSIYRSYVLFNRIDTGVDINKHFKSRTHLTLHEFYVGLFFLLLYFRRHLVNPTLEFDGTLYSEDIPLASDITAMPNFIKLINLLTFRNENIESLQRIRNESYQLYETMLWNVYPFIQVDENYLLIHPSILDNMVSFYVYDQLRKKSGPVQTDMGRRMELYVKLGLDELKLPYVDEKELDRRYKPKMVCDYLVNENILIECKAIDLSPTAGIVRTKPILQNEFDKTAIKAHKQILSVAQKAKSSLPMFGVVITYKERSLGFGVDCWDEFLSEPIIRFANQESISLNETVPPERLVYITLEDWDLLLQTMLFTKKTMQQILEIGFEMHSKSQILFFHQVLENLVGGAIPPTLTYLEQVKSVFDRRS